MLRRLVVALCAIMAIGALSAQAHRLRHSGWQDDNLVVISEQDVDLSLDRYSIDVSTAKGAYKGIRVKNKSGYLFDLSSVQIVYSDGSTHNEDRQIDMYQGERSRPINPTSESRFIDRVNITQVPGRGRGRLQILGIQDRHGARMSRTGGDEYANDRYSGRSSGNGSTVTRQPAATPPALETRPTAPLATTTPPGRASDGGDVLFGAQYVGFGVDRDVIRVGAEIGKFERIRLRVLDNDIFINEMKIVYTNGETDTLAVNANVPKNSRTNWIDLKGDRFIKEIQLVYRSRPSFRGQARIEVFGKYAPGWLGPKGEGRKYNQGWVLLGAQTAGFVGFDKDVIPVGANEGGFKRIRVTVRDRAITLNEVKVIYTDGTDETIPVRTRVDAGGTYGPIDLKGQRRAAIDRIEAKYRSRFFDSSARGKGSAIVEIWGQH
ncbi:MAG TPA: DUF2541 family protein [Hyphomicrobium sp.]|nr:DUF2541 family protein [Hyphomicrobium sp.]